MPSAASQRGIGQLSTSSHSLPNTADEGAASSSSSLAAPLPPTTPSPSTSRPSLLSRLSLPLPLRNRNRNVADFHVRPDEPYRNYGAGDHVRGSVVLTIVKPVRMTHLVVSLTGFVRVFKDPVAGFGKMQSAAALLPHGGSTRPQYHGNGLASLFQDEQVLSGEGRLDPGKYEFGFDLVFPEKGLPSSIDFERGTISYMVTATLTRPTSINATTSCDRRVVLVEKVDIGLLPPPRPRTIFLEPISKRTRRRKSMGLDKAAVITPDITEVASEAETVSPATVHDDPTTPRDQSAEQRSPVQYDMRSESGGSARSVSTAISRTEFAQLSQVGTTFASPSKQQVVDNKTITTTIELLRGGCLPGDMVSVRVTVQHVKRIKSMTGVVVTLFRQGKIDTSPPQSAFGGLVGRNEFKSMQKDDIYPRSRTGIGGLSLSSTSSTSMFRKDLDQNAAPLITDPETLQAVVTVSLKIPDDAFPTIMGVPGDMIGFKYQVEVIVDLGGRLSNMIQSGSSSTSRFGPFSANASDQSNSVYGSRRGSVVADTAPLRREKGVVSVTMETVVGTVDSSRGQKKRDSPRRVSRAVESDDDDAIRPDTAHPEEIPYTPPYTNGHPAPGGHSAQPGGPTYFSIPPPSFPSHLQLQTTSLPGPSQPGYNHVQDASPVYVPPPQLPQQHNMSEKDRIRLAETRLLPSQPPAGPSEAPSAPEATDDDDIYDAEAPPRPADSALPPADVDAGPSAPTEEEVSSPANVPHEDKQERERQRLMNEASAPPDMPADIEQGNGGPSTAAEAEPSAPVLDEEDGDPYSGYGVGAGPSRRGGSHDAEPLPAYER
ncbi:hypothetical protein B0I35DRAFT_473367 [Stachybotrys elegans]|uniref:Arrestin C-terminal-like domain-containing protein n=1 Tax=Stachybotrys elegans TaxID=80388 RepID=A0A8K0T7B8_9HYPO|nr:hypothetical protein B0I35DRAFT_473367 [Stachybotrys elegans]